MTIEEILAKIEAGVTPENLQEIEDSLTDLIGSGKKTPAGIAIRLAQAKSKFSNDIGWAVWARDKFGFDPKNKTVHHRRQVGDMLLAVFPETPALYRRLLVAEITKLEVLTEYFRKKGVVALINLFETGKVNTDEMGREQIRAIVNGLLKKPERQPSLPGFEEALEKLVAVDEEKLMAMTLREDFDGDKALSMGSSGLMLGKAAATWVAGHAEDVDVDFLEELAADARAISDNLNRALELKRRKQLEI